MIKRLSGISSGTRFPACRQASCSLKEPGTVRFWFCLLLIIYSTPLSAAARTDDSQNQSHKISSEQACREKGGEWGQFGLMVEPQCNLPTSDAGKICFDASECEGDCIATLTPEQNHQLETGGSISTQGKCSATQLNFGCHPFVRSGQVHGILCVD